MRVKAFLPLIVITPLLLASSVRLAIAQDVIVPMGPTGEIQQFYRSFDGGAWEAPVVAIAPYDDETGASITIDVVHHEVHEGEMCMPNARFRVYPMQPASIC